MSRYDPATKRRVLDPTEQMTSPHKLPDEPAKVDPNAEPQSQPRHGYKRNEPIPQPGTVAIPQPTEGADATQPDQLPEQTEREAGNVPPNENVASDEEQQEIQSRIDSESPAKGKKR